VDKENILTLVKKWTAEVGLTVREIADPRVNLHILINEPNLPGIDLVHPKAEDTYVLFISSIGISDEDRKKLLDINKEKREALLWIIRQRLILMGVEFRLERGDDIPTVWHVYARLYFQNPSTQNFWETYLKIKNASFLISWAIHEGLDLRIL